MGDVIRFPGKRTPKMGFRRVAGRQRELLEREGQLSLFGAPAGKVVSLPRRLSPFEEALLLDERGDDRAAERYRNAIDRGDCVAESYCNLGIIESEHGRSASAFDCFTLSLVNDPRHFESHYNLGNLYLDEGDFRLARLHYEICAVLEPGFPDTYFNLGLVLAMTREFELAVDALSHYKRLVPEDEASRADELLASLRKSAAASR